MKDDKVRICRWARATTPAEHFKKSISLDKNRRLSGFGNGLACSKSSTPPSSNSSSLVFIPSGVT